MACVRSQRKHTYVFADTRVITYVISSVMSSRQGGLAGLGATRSFQHVGTEIYRRLRLRHMTCINKSRPSIHPENLKSYNRVVECGLHICSVIHCEFLIGVIKYYLTKDQFRRGKCYRIESKKESFLIRVTYCHKQNHIVHTCSYMKQCSA